MPLSQFIDWICLKLELLTLCMGEDGEPPMNNNQKASPWYL
jgi:hypothetical protein